MIYNYRNIIARFCAITPNERVILLSRSEAKKRADKKYRTKILHNGTKKQINATLNIDDYNMINDFCNNMEISKAAFITGACRYVIENQRPVSELKNNKNT